MEFSYRVSEKDYVQAWKIACKSRKPPVVKTRLFWVLILFFLALLFRVVEMNLKHERPVKPEQAQSISVRPVASGSIGNIVSNVGPLVVILGFWIVLLFSMGPARARRMYRKDTNLHGEITVRLDSQSVAIESSVGTFFQSGWNAFTDWREAQDITVLRFPNTTFLIVNTNGLPESQRGELRGILAVALPKK
jgi:hypothetical protein